MAMARLVVVNYPNVSQMCLGIRIDMIIISVYYNNLLKSDGYRDRGIRFMSSRLRFFIEVIANK